MEKGYKIKVNITTGLEDYKNAFLAIYNNCKASPELLHFENDYDNGIYITCLEEDAEAVEKWLQQFGEVSKSPVFIKFIEADATDKEWQQADAQAIDIDFVFEY